MLGPEFSKDAGKVELILWTLKLLITSISFKSQLASCMHKIRYELRWADLYLLMKLGTRPNNKVRYYSYVL